MLVRTMMIERAVHQGLAIDGKVVGIEAEYMVQPTGKGLVIAAQVMEVVDEGAECHGTESLRIE